jgi:hypothetical protein
MGGLAKGQPNSEVREERTGGVLMWTNGRAVTYTGKGDEFWTGNWKETSAGLRDQLISGSLDTTEPWIEIRVGSLVIAGSGEFRGTPSGKFLRFQLEDSNGVVLPMRPGIILEERFAKSIRSADMPVQLSQQDVASVHFNSIPWTTNGGPTIVDVVQLRDLYEITNEGNYTLTVRPAIYQYEKSWTNLVLVELPLLSTNVHLLRLMKPPVQSEFGKVLALYLVLPIAVVSVLWLTRRRVEPGVPR